MRRRNSRQLLVATDRAGNGRWVFSRSPDRRPGGAAGAWPAAGAAVAGAGLEVALDRLTADDPPASSSPLVAAAGTGTNAAACCADPSLMLISVKIEI